MIRWTTAFFKKKGLDSPRLQAELLLAEVLGCERVRLYVDFEQPIRAEALARFRAFVKRRGEEREPLQYILGHAPFLDLTLRVSPAVLIPRPESEELAEWAIGALKAMPGDALRALDLGTGSGCLALALAAKEPRVRVTAVESSSGALAVARENAGRLELDGRIQFREGDLFEPLSGGDPEAPFDVIVSNPPYVDPAQKETLQPEVRDHEPPAALFSDEQGLALLRAIIAGAGAWLKPGGRLGLEIAPELSASVRGLLEENPAYEAIEIRRDFRQQERFALALRGA